MHWSNGHGEVNPGVPVPAKFVWSIVTCFNAESFRGWSKTNKLIDQTDDFINKDCGAKIAKQLLVASSMPLFEAQHEVLGRAVRIALSVDEKDASFLCRLKIVATNPAVKCYRMFGGVLRDCSHDIDGTVGKIINLMDEICTKRSGRRDGSGITGPNDVKDIDLKNTIFKKIFCCSSDGAEVMVQALQKMQRTFPNVRYQFRDAAHSTNCIGKSVEKHANHANELKEFLVTGDDSFIKRIRYQSNAKEDWKSIDGGDNFEDFLDLASAPHRWHTKSRAMSTLCLKIIKVIRMITKWADDSNPNRKDRKIWASNGLRIIHGKKRVRQTCQLWS